MNILKRQQANEGYIRTVVVKARRVGMSSLFDGLAFCHCLARPQAHAEIVAHEMKTSELGLFRVPHDLAEEMEGKFEGTADVRVKRVYFHHETGDSLLDIATAGSIAGGRGLTLTFAHLSEAAQYPGSDSFLSLLPAVSKAPDTIIAVESTAFGKTGPGQTFYDFWNAANLNPKHPKWNGYVPIFLSWLDDPACVRDPEEATDAPATDLERELMGKPFLATRAQIAWMRRVFEGECAGEEPKFLQEYPHSADVAFVATGDPAFPRDEMTYAESTKKDPIKRGHLRRKGTTQFEFIPSRQGPLVLWEEPLNKCHYYLGADAAAGYETGDFSTYAILNGTTGKMAGRYEAHANPEELADQCDMAGRWFNDAMVNIELTGNLGRWAQKLLRDRHVYPNIYRWKGKDDRLSGKGRSDSGGWETNQATRGLMRDAFREKLRAGMKNIPGGLEVYDEELIRQMSIATLRQGLKWEVERGHDDVLVAWMLAIVTCAQYPPPNIMSFKSNILETPAVQHASVQAALHAQPNWRHALRDDLNYILRPNRKTVRTAVEF